MVYKFAPGRAGWSSARKVSHFSGRQGVSGRLRHAPHLRRTRQFPDLNVAPGDETLQLAQEIAKGHRALEARVARDCLVVVPDAVGVLADEVDAQIADRVAHQVVVLPLPRFTRAYDAGVGIYPHDETSIDQRGRDVLDLRCPGKR